MEFHASLPPLPPVCPHCVPLSSSLEMFHDEVGTNSAVTDNSVSEKKKKGGERDEGNINLSNLWAVRSITGDFQRPCLLRATAAIPIAY